MNTTSIKVRVPVSVEIDTEALSLEYGLDGSTAAELRAYAKTYIQDMVNQQLAAMGLLA